MDQKNLAALTDRQLGTRKLLIKRREKLGQDRNKAREELNQQA
jgi:hypothetical protein